MNANIFVLKVTSGDPTGLHSFYSDVLKLQPAEGFGEGALAAAGAVLNFEANPAAIGRTKEPRPFLLDFVVDDLAAEQERLEAQGVTFVRTAVREWWGGVISTFIDPDGNYGQLIEVIDGPTASIGSEN